MSFTCTHPNCKTHVNAEKSAQDPVNDGKRIDEKSSKTDPDMECVTYTGYCLKCHKIHPIHHHVLRVQVDGFESNAETQNPSNAPHESNSPTKAAPVVEDSSPEDTDISKGLGALKLDEPDHTENQKLPEPSTSDDKNDQPPTESSGSSDKDQINKKDIVYKLMEALVLSGVSTRRYPDGKIHNPPKKDRSAEKRGWFKEDNPNEITEKATSVLVFDLFRVIYDVAKKTCSSIMVDSKRNQFLSAESLAKACWICHNKLTGILLFARHIHNYDSKEELAAVLDSIKTFVDMFRSFEGFYDKICAEKCSSVDDEKHRTEEIWENDNAIARKMVVEAINSHGGTKTFNVIMSAREWHNNLDLDDAFTNELTNPKLKWVLAYKEGYICSVAAK